MDLSASAIIQQLQQGRKTDEIKANVTWISLSTQDLNLLLEQTTKWQNEACGYELCRLLYGITPKTEYSFRCKILARVITRDNLPSDKNILLNLFREIMKNWRDALAISHDKKQIDLYQIFDMDFHWLCGYVFEEKGEFAKAQERYQASLDGFQKLGYKNGIQRATQKLEALKSRKPGDQGAIPLEILQDRRTILQAEIAKLTEEVNNIEQLQKIKQGEVVDQEINLENLQKQNVELSDKLQINQDTLKKISKEIKGKKKELISLEIGLQFLTTLSKMAMAPLWVEVVRLALEKGQIDSFTIQALNYLAVDHPQEAIPLLAEIAARSPEPFSVDTEHVQTGLAQWFSLIAEARLIQKDNEVLAAQKMVDAWDTFFSIVKNGSDLA